MQVNLDFNFKVPKGFKLTGDMRVPKLSDWFINYQNKAQENTSGCPWIYDDPAHLRLIIEKLPKPKTLTLTQVIGTTEAKPGEFYRSGNKQDSGSIWRNNGATTLPLAGSMALNNWEVFTLTES